MLIIATCVFRFRVYYLQGIQNYTAFHLLLLVFVLSMLALILRPNVFRLILG